MGEEQIVRFLKYIFPEEFSTKTRKASAQSEKVMLVMLKQQTETVFTKISIHSSDCYQYIQKAP